ncbi:uncharacterized protein LOC143898005 [Temnothorax americanus]|uniref:uncharacterized protein LOC143898005 n=1 Tax=Temnothorax americanus TaxID=1964332 RepID=UPI0040687DD5
MEAVQRIAVRASRSYRTVAHVGATTLARIPPAHLLARYYAESYEAMRQTRKRLGGIILPKIKNAIKVITGHGCFGRYLHSIGKKRTTRCHHCPEEADTAQHTLEHCPAWGDERRVLWAAIRKDLSLPAVIERTAGTGAESTRRWEAFVSFCDKVMWQKKADERIRKGEAAPPPSSNSKED